MLYIHSEVEAAKKLLRRTGHYVIEREKVINLTSMVEVSDVTLQRAISEEPILRAVYKDLHMRLAHEMVGMGATEITRTKSKDNYSTKFHVNLQVIPARVEVDPMLAFMRDSDWFKR